MIKFKKILQKASAQAGQTVGAAVLAPEPAGRRLAPLHEPARTVAPPSATDTYETPRKPPAEPEAAPFERNAIERPAAEKPTAEIPAAKDVSARDQAESPAADASASDDIAADILREMSIDNKAFDAMKIAEDAESSGDEVRDETSPLTVSPDDLRAMLGSEGADRPTQDSPDQDGGHVRSGDTAVDAIGQAVDSVLTASMAGEQEEAATPEAPEEAPAEKASPAAGKREGELDTAFMDEIDRLLSEFGQVTADDVPLPAAAEPEAGQAEDAENSGGGAAAPDMSEALSEAEREALAAISEATDAAEGMAKDIARAAAEAAAQAKAQKAALGREQKRAKNGKAQAEADRKKAGGTGLDDDADPSDAPRDGNEAAAMGAMGETLTSEEKEALTADAEDADGSSQAAGAVAREVDDVFAEKPGGFIDDTNELVLDFTASSVGLEPEKKDEEDKAAGEGIFDTSDLLSKVLADLDKLGPTEKPKEAAPVKEEPMDFTQILAGDGPPPKAPADDAQEAHEDRPEPARQEEPKRGKPAKPSKRDEKPEAAEDALAREIIEETIDEEAPAAEDEAESEETFDPFSDGAIGGAGEGSGEAAAEKVDEVDEGEVGDEAGPAAAESSESDVQASLNASVEAAEKVQEIQRRRSGEPIPAEELSEEDRIREEVLSRTKEVDQKVLDEVFGADKEKFRSQIKAEMAQDGKGKASVKAQGALSRETERRQAEGAGGGSAHAPEWQPSAFEAMYETIASALLWLAFQMNRPFERWLTPARRQVLAIVSACFIMTSVVLLAATSALRFLGK